MQKSQLIEVVKTLDKKEIRGLKKWLRSPFHNQRQDVIDLFDYLIKNDNYNKPQKLGKVMVFPFLYPDEPYDDTKIRQSMFFLLKSIESYLVYLKVSDDLAKNKINWSAILREKGLLKYSKKALNDAKHALQKAENYNSREFHNDEMLYHREQYDLALLENRNAQTESEIIVEKLDRTFIAERLWTACITIASPNISFKEDDVQFVESIIKHIDNDEKLLRDESVKIYYLIYKVVINREDNVFTDLKSTLINSKGFDPQQLREIFLLVINYCIRQMNRGRRHYIREAFSLYKIGIENATLIENSKIGRRSFRNIVSVGVNAQEFQWVENFITNYQKYLDEQHRESYVNFCFGLLYSKSGQYEKAITYLAQFEPDDVLLNLNSKVQLIKIYYELDESIALESLIESSKVYLRRKKDVSDQYRMLYKNLIRFTQKLLRVNPYDKSKKAKLRKEIEEANPLIEKQWFLNQLEKI